MNEVATNLLNAATAANAEMDELKSTILTAGHQIASLSNTIRLHESTIDFLRQDVKALGGDPDASQFADTPSHPLTIAARAGIIRTMGGVSDKEAYLRAAGWKMCSTGWIDPKSGGSLWLEAAVDKQSMRDMAPMRHLLKTPGVEQAKMSGIVNPLVEFEKV